MASSTQVPSRACALGATAVTLAWLSVGLPAAVAMGSYRPAVLAEDGVVTGDGNVVVLEPEKWIGKRFPLLDLIEVDEAIDRGRWTVVMHSRGCVKCDGLIRDYENGDFEFGTESIAFVALESCYEVPVRRVFRADVSGCMRGEYTWFVETPLELRIDDGEVVSIRDGTVLREPSLGGSLVASGIR